MDMILLYDGNCGLCSYAVKFVDRFDKNHRIKLISLNSKLAVKIFNEFKVSNDIDSVVFIKYDKIYFKSDAVIEAGASCNSIFKLLRLIKIIPRRLRDFIYDLIAKYRKKFFRISKSCVIHN